MGPTTALLHRTDCHDWYTGLRTFNIFKVDTSSGAVDEELACQIWNKVEPVEFLPRKLPGHLQLAE